MKVFARSIIVLFCCLYFGMPTLAFSGSELPYEYSCVGNKDNIVAKPKSGIALMGGSTDSDDAFKWFIRQASNADILILRVSGGDAYNKYIYELGKVNSVETIVFKSSEAASNPFVLNKINKAEGIFFPGGDQWKYITMWKNTPIQKALNDAINRGVVIGGTSAGLAILGEFCFSAQNGSAVSNEALSDPYYWRMCLDTGMFDFAILKNTITDSHFSKRDRMGRLIGFLARLVQDGCVKEAIGIGIDERTALLVNAGGIGTLCGEGAAYILKTKGQPENCRRKQFLTFRGIATYKMLPGSHFDFKQFKGEGGIEYTLSAEHGAVTSTNNGEIY